MTSATHLRLDEQSLAQTSTQHALDAAKHLKKMLDETWPDPGSKELEAHVLQFEEQLIKAAIFLRRVQDKSGRPSVHNKKGTSLHAPFEAFEQNGVVSDDLRLVANKIVHHRWLHAEDSGNSKIEIVTSECDQDTFTQFRVTQFCDEIIKELDKGRPQETPCLS